MGRSQARGGHCNCEKAIAQFSPWLGQWSPAQVPEGLWDVLESL